MRVRKRIPEGAGLGGGSSDAAATLVALARLWNLPVTAVDLVPVAAELGSDVPFFLVGGTARCRGRGERVESWAEAFDAAGPFHYVLVYPKVKVSTKIAYDSLDAARGPAFTLTPPSPLDSMRPVEVQVRLRGGQLFYNRFEEIVYRIFPEVGRVCLALSEEPFVKVLMSGSGSTIYGLCRSAPEAEATAQRLRRRLDADILTASSERCHEGFGRSGAVPEKEHWRWK